MKKFDIKDILAILGLSCIFYGLHQIYPPAAYILSGGFLFWLGIGGDK